MNTGVHVSFLIQIFVYSGYMLRSEIAGSYSNLIFSVFLRHSYTILNGDYTDFCNVNWCSQITALNGTYSPTYQFSSVQLSLSVMSNSVTS